MDQQAQPTPPTNEALQTPIPLTLTVNQINAILKVLNTGPYQEVKPLIELVMEQAQSYVNKLNASTQTNPTPVPTAQANAVPSATPESMLPLRRS